MISEEQRYINSATKGFFTNPADENYLIARWCYLQRLYANFFWNAAQSVEKFLKASLVLNDRIVKGFGHDLVRLYDEVAGFASDLLPLMLICPNQLEASRWKTEATRDWLERLNRFGNPDGRYGLVSHWVRPDDLPKFDAIIFTLRRLAVRLTDPCVDFGNSDENITNKAMLERDLRWQPAGKMFGSTMYGNREAALSHSTVAQLNLAFSENPGEVTGTLPGMSATKSWLGLLAGDAAEEAPQKNDLARAGAIDWLLSRVRLQKDIEQELVSARDALARRSRGL